MRISVDPSRVELVENQPFSVMVTVTNTGTVIGGYHLRVLGADPSWVTLDAENLSLFPETSQTVRVTVRIPPGVGAGDRRIAVQVRELTPPQSIAVAEIELMVPPREAMKMGLQPMTVICGRTGNFSLLAENTGNTPMAVAPLGLDPEDKLRFEFIPAVLELAPGEHLIADMRVTGRRRWFGSPVVKPFGVAAQSLSAAAGMAPAAVPGELAAPEPPPEPPEPLAKGTMMQKPRLGRGLLSLLSLLLAVSVFAVVITIALSRLVGVSAADRDLALQVASARTAGAGGGSSALGGTVKRSTDGQPAEGIAVEVFSAGDLTQPLISTATAANGTWAITSLSAGAYEIRFRGAGFVEIWFPSALDSSGAQQIQLADGQKLTNLDVALGGLPSSVSGQVLGNDVAGAVLTVQVPADQLAPVTSGGHPAPSAQTPGLRAGSGGSRAGPAAVVSPEAAPAPAATPQLAPSPQDVAAGGIDPRSVQQRQAVVSTSASGTATGTATGTAQPGGVLTTVPIAGDGLFSVTNLPSPGVYDLIVSKVGYATDTQRIDLAGGEARTGVILRLSTGDGLISGTIVGPNGPIGGAVVTATTGTTSVKTLSVTTPSALGTFTLRGLVTPASYTVSVSMDGFTTVTSNLSLSADQQLTDVRLALSKASGTLAGIVTTVSDGKPAGGVTVTVAAGNQTVTTVTQSGAGAGTWAIANLPIPGSYTLTFSRADLQSQTVAVAIDAAGQVTGTSSASGAVNVAMRSAYASVIGVVRQQFPSGLQPIGEATVSLTSGNNTYTVATASIPIANKGHYVIDDVVPGTYTISASSKGTSPTTEIITVTAGQVLTQNIQLIQPASISGVVTLDGVPQVGYDVDLYVSTNYPNTVTATVTTDATGHYSFTNVDAPQAYVLSVRSPSSGPLATGTIALQPSQSGTLDFPLKSGAPGNTTQAPPTTTATTPTGSTANVNSTGATTSSTTRTCSSVVGGPPCG
jgi:5-hydroxyisourate hydrolase-like protein (transthyretin family)